MAVPSPLGRRQTVAALLTLTFVTGLVDAVSYLRLGRVFVANMTGTDRRLGSVAAMLAGGAAGAGILQWSPTAVIAGAALLVTLVAGALVTAIPQVGGLSPPAGRSRSTTVSA